MIEKAPPPIWRKPFGIVIAKFNTTRFGKNEPPRRWYRWYATERQRVEAVNAIAARYLNKKAWRIGTIEGRPGEWDAAKTN